MLATWLRLSSTIDKRKTVFWHLCRSILMGTLCVYPMAGITICCHDHGLPWSPWDEKIYWSYQSQPYSSFDVTVQYRQLKLWSLKMRLMNTFPSHSCIARNMNEAQEAVCLQWDWNSVGGRDCWSRASSRIPNSSNPTPATIGSWAPTPFQLVPHSGSRGPQSATSAASDFMGYHVVYDPAGQPFLVNLESASSEWNSLLDWVPWDGLQHWPKRGRQFLLHQVFLSLPS